MPGGAPSQNALLTTVATPLTLDEAQALARDRFGLAARARALTSERDQNFHLAADDGGEYVLKIANPAEHAGVLDFQTLALRRIAERDPEAPVSRVFESLDGHAAVVLEHAGEPPRIVRLLSFLRGTILHQVASTPALRADLGRVHARVGLALKGFDHPAAGHELMWDLKHAGRLRELAPHIADPARRALAEQALDAFARHAEPRFPGLRTQVIHNDLNPHNVVVDPADHTHIAGVLDFGDMVRAPLVCDVAVAASYLVGQEEGPLGGAPDYVAAYHATVPLEAADLDVLFDLIVTRLAMTVLITGWRAARYPENRDYILRNNAPAWAGLEKLAGLSRADARALLQAACDGPA